MTSFLCSEPLYQVGISYTLPLPYQSLDRRAGGFAGLYQARSTACYLPFFLPFLLDVPDVHEIDSSHRRRQRASNLSIVINYIQATRERHFIPPVIWRRCAPLAHGNALPTPDIYGT